MPLGFFIALEGIDGSGTTTHCQLLAKWLRGQNKRVFQTHEPTSNGIGKLIRITLRDQSVKPATDALLFAADRVYHTTHEIQPALEKGMIVISDRYVESSIAYQTASGLSIEWVQEINKFAKKPDLTILLDVPPEISLKRKKYRRPKDKFETIPFLEKVRQIFLTRAKELAFPIINADDSIHHVQTKVQNEVTQILTRVK
jgi:dTMP kinase